MGLGKGNGKGGCRRGAGRPAGARGKAVIEREALAKARAEAKTMPLDWLLQRLADTTLSPDYRDKLATMAAPYCSPRLSAVAVTKRPAQMTDEEIAEMIGLTEEDMLRLGIGRGDKWPRPVH
jgi:hypothetical protein